MLFRRKVQWLSYGDGIINLDHVSCFIDISEVRVSEYFLLRLMRIQ
jgi:hypothetical protein